MKRRPRLGAAVVALASAAWVGAVAGCTPPPPGPTGTTATSSTPPAPLMAELRLPTAPTTVLTGPADVAASRALFATSPVVVLAPADDLGAQLEAGSAAVALGAPLLLVASPTAPSGTASDGVTATSPSSGSTATTATSPATTSTPTQDAWREEVRRLAAVAVLEVGDLDVDVPGLVVAHARDAAALAHLVTGAPTPVPDGGQVGAAANLDRAHPAMLEAAPAPTPTPDPSEAASATPTSTAPTTAPTTSSDSAPTTALPATAQAPPAGPGLLLTDGDPGTFAAVVTARAAGQPVVVVPGGDPRATPASVQAVAAVATPATRVLAVGPQVDALGGAAEVDWRVRTAATGVELPGGGQLVFAHKRLVALYGSPGFPGLGLLGEQDLPATLERARQLAATYQALTDATVVPTLEIIATIASAGPGDDQNYSNEISVESLRPWVEAARDAGQVVILDLQPGRTDFLTQAKEYEALLAYPNVGLALDPEWRLKPDQVHLRQIGSVGIDEVNAVAAWLADLTRRDHLPQKPFVLHQFMLRMISDRARLDTSHAELAYVIHVDGQGSQGAKAATWQAIRKDAPAGVVWGWKNFIDEDKPTLTPEQTYQITPTPVLVSYQ